MSHYGLKKSLKPIFRREFDWMKVQHTFSSKDENKVSRKGTVLRLEKLGKRWRDGRYF
jgi:hypothetical protein